MVFHAAGHGGFAFLLMVLWKFLIRESLSVAVFWVVLVELMLFLATPPENMKIFAGSTSASLSVAQSLNFNVTSNQVFTFVAPCISAS